MIFTIVTDGTSPAISVLSLSGPSTKLDKGVMQVAYHPNPLIKRKVMKYGGIVLNMSLSSGGYYLKKHTLLHHLFISKCCAIQHVIIYTFSLLIG
jgi:hypothetical protein